MRLEIHFEARAEFLEAVCFMKLECQVLGTVQIARIDGANRRLLDTPLIGSPYGRRLRKFTVGDKFPYSIVYAVLADGLYIVAYATRVEAPGLLAGRGHPGSKTLNRHRGFTEVSRSGLHCIISGAGSGMGTGIV